jgi:hypothetical protein
MPNVYPSPQMQRQMQSGTPSLLQPNLNNSGQASPAQPQNTSYTYNNHVNNGKIQFSSYLSFSL